MLDRVSRVAQRRCTSPSRIKSLRTTRRSLCYLDRHGPRRAIYVQHLAPYRTTVARPSPEFCARLSHDCRTTQLSIQPSLSAPSPPA